MKTTPDEYWALPFNERWKYSALPDVAIYIPIQGEDADGKPAKAQLVLVRELPEGGRKPRYEETGGRVSRGKLKRGRRKRFKPKLPDKPEGSQMGLGFEKKKSGEPR